MLWGHVYTCGLSAPCLGTAGLFGWLQDDEARMAGCIADLQAAMAAMSEDPCNRSRLYLTDRELAALPCMAHDTVFAVRASTRLHGTYSINAVVCDTKEDRPLGYRYVALAHSVELLSEGHAVCWLPPADANMQVWAAAGVMLRPW